MNTKWIGFALLAIVGAVGAMWATGHIDLKALAGLDGNAGRPASANVYKPPTISVIRPEQRHFVETLRINGSLVAREEVLIAPQLEGQRIRELLVDAGSAVTKGQLLAKLATENLDALVAQNDATILRADASIAQAHSSITQAKARLTETMASLKRAKPLSKSGYLSESILEQRQSAATSAQAAVAMSKDSLKLAESEKAQALAQRRELLWRRSHTDIHASVDGFVLSKSAKVGAIATATGEPMFRIAKGGEVELEGEVNSDQLHRLKSGQIVTIEGPGNVQVSGTVRLVLPRVDADTRLGHVRVYIGVNQRLHVGTFASGIIEIARGQGLAIPANAVMRDSDGPYVQVAVDNKVRMKRIVLGLHDADFVEIRDGLTAKDRVIAKAGTFLGEGELITPVEALDAGRLESSAKAG